MADPEEKPPNKPGLSKPAIENGGEDIRRSESFTEEELAKQLKDKDIARALGELLKAQKVAAIYIDQRSGGVFFSDETYIGGDVIGKTQFKKEESRGGKTRPGETVSEVLVSDLKKIVSVYVCPLRYETAREILAQRNVLILCGRAHHGKYTTALHLLHNLHGDTIFELDPLANPETLDFSGKPAQGYVIDSYSTESVEKITRFQLNRLSGQLQTCGAHLVITVDERTALPRESLENYLSNWDDLPNQKDLIEKHLDWYALDSTIRQQAAALCADKEVQPILDQPLLPGEVDQLAGLLIDAASGKLTLAEALERFEIRTSQQVAHWFENHPAIDDRIFLLSAAVYNGASRQTVTNAEKQLLTLLPKDDENKPTASSMFGSAHSQRIHRIGANIKPGYEDTEFGRNPVEILELNNPSMQPAVIQYVWKEFDRLREIVVRWLGEAVIDTPFDMRVRAAAAVGELAKHDFSYIRREVLIPWGTHPDYIVRGAAAFALGIPAWESEKAPLVLGLLHHWSTLNNWRLCWTAAAAYGGLVGLRFPDAALRDLCRIAQKGELRLLAILTQSMVNLFNVGEIVPEYRKKVLDALTEWTEKPKNILGITGLFVFLYLADTARINADPEGDSWPILLWLIRRDESLTHQTCELWRRALNLKVTRSTALSTLHRWLKIVDKDSRLYENLAWLFQAIAHQETEREGDRLRHFLRGLREQPEVTLTATRILETL